MPPELVLEEFPKRTRVSRDRHGLDLLFWFHSMIDQRSLEMMSEAPYNRTSFFEESCTNRNSWTRTNRVCRIRREYEIGTDWIELFGFDGTECDDAIQLRDERLHGVIRLGRQRISLGSWTESSAMMILRT